MGLGFIFPGQGSQSVGMLGEMARQHEMIVETFAEASQALGYDLWKLIQEGPEEALNATEKTQPAMLAAGVGLWRVWLDRDGAAPLIMAGHSLGEYTALVCAGSLGFQDAILLVADRGRYMQEAVPRGTGAMAAVLGISDQQVAEVCEQAAQGQIVSSANFNSPAQVVIAGHMDAVARAVELAKEAGAKRAVMLPVSVPSHCALMQSAAERLFDRLQAIAINQPTIPVMHNVDVSTHSEPEAVVSALVAQLHRPVRWVEVIAKMSAAGATELIEAGPGKVLSGLCKRIDRSLVCRPVFDSTSLQVALGAS